MVHDLSSVLRNTSSKTDHTKFSIISKAQINEARIRGFQSSEMSHTPHQGDIQRDTLSFNITPTQPAPHVLVASGSRTNEAEQCQSNEPLDIEI